MKWLDTAAQFIAPLVRIAKSLEAIDTSLQRIADAQQGIQPNPRVVPEAPPEPATLAPAMSDRDFAKIEAIETRWLAVGGRLPTSEEICRELDGEVVPDQVLQDEFARLRRMPDAPDGD